MSEALKVLIIEDDPDVRLGCEQALQLEGIATESVGSAEEGQRRLQKDFRGVIVSDFGGMLTGSNHPGGGAVFTLELPLAEDISSS